jgi:hypothetical protein
MSRLPMGSDGGAWAMDPLMNYDTSFVPQGIGADLIATIDNVSRETVDTFALQSQQRAAKARAEGRFVRSLIPVRDRNGMLLLSEDEFIRPNTTLEGLGKLQPSFQLIGELGGFDAVALQKYHYLESIQHVHTAGHSSGIVDGAALVLIGSDTAGQAAGLTPRGRIVSTALSGADPTIMLTGPAPGMMGSGIAYVSAKAGIACVIKDVSKERAEHGKDYSRKLVEKAVARGNMTSEAGAALLGLIQTTGDAADLAGCDMLIEAVFENRELKAAVTREAEANVALSQG